MNHINVIDSTSTTHRLLSNYYSRQFSGVDNFKKIPNQQEVVEMEMLEKSWLTGEFNNLENEILPKNSVEFKEWYRGVCKESRKESAFLFEFLSKKASTKQGIRVRQAISLEYYMDLHHQMVSQ